MPSRNGFHSGRVNGKAPVPLIVEREERAVRPTQFTGQEVFLAKEEIIVSKTDLNGKLTYVNDVFLRISGYSERELLGQPHSVIRHPDMPRCVFKLFWDTISAGQEIFAYVVNATKDGGHYWVLAHVTPSFDVNGNIIGYHSNRRSPDREAVEFIKPLYAKLVAMEKGRGRTQESVAASLAQMQSWVCEQHGSYEKFILTLAKSKGAVL